MNPRFQVAKTLGFYVVTDSTSPTVACNCTNIRMAERIAQLLNADVDYPEPVSVSKPVEERPDVLGFDQCGRPVK